MGQDPNAYQECTLHNFRIILTLFLTLQPESRFPGKQHPPSQLPTTGTPQESQAQFNRQPLQQGGQPQQVCSVIKNSPCDSRDSISFLLGCKGFISSVSRP